jgi:hypothetical protein
MALLCAASLPGLLVDGRTLVNTPIWLKPLKFSDDGRCRGVAAVPTAAGRALDSALRWG